MSSSGAYDVRRGWTAQEHADAARFLTFVQVARGCVFTGSTLELLDLAPVTVCIGPDGAGSLGRVTTGAFLDLWWLVAETPLGESGRGAVVALVDPDRGPWDDARVQLSQPRIHRSGLQYDAELIEGVLPSSSGSCVLFIAPAAAPLPPERKRS